MTVNCCMGSVTACRCSISLSMRAGEWQATFAVSQPIYSMISTFVSPVFRAMPCLGQDSCYPLAFGKSCHCAIVYKLIIVGIPGILMIIATGEMVFSQSSRHCSDSVAFVSGSYWYKKLPVESNVFADVWRVIRVSCARSIGLSN